MPEAAYEYDKPPVRAVFVFGNRMAVVTGASGRQIPELQGRWDEVAVPVLLASDTLTEWNGVLMPPGAVIASPWRAALLAIEGMLDDAGVARSTAPAKDVATARDTKENYPRLSLVQRVHQLVEREREAIPRLVDAQHALAGAKAALETMRTALVKGVSPLDIRPLLNVIEAAMFPKFDPQFNCPTHFAGGDPSCPACQSKQPRPLQ